MLNSFLSNLGTSWKGEEIQNASEWAGFKKIPQNPQNNQHSCSWYTGQDPEVKFYQRDERMLQRLGAFQSKRGPAFKAQHQATRTVGKVSIN